MEKGNPFHTRRYRSFALFAPLFRAFGFVLCIVRCNWLPGKWRPTLVFVGWRE